MGAAYYLAGQAGKPDVPGRRLQTTLDSGSGANGPVQGGGRCPSELWGLRKFGSGPIRRGVPALWIKIHGPPIYPFHGP